MKTETTTTAPTVQIMRRHSDDQAATILGRDYIGLTMPQAKKLIAKHAAELREMVKRYVPNDYSSNTATTLIDETFAGARFEYTDRTGARVHYTISFYIEPTDESLPEDIDLADIRG